MIFSEICEYLGSRLKVPTEKKWISSLYNCLFEPDTKNRKSNFMMILCKLYDIMILANFMNISALG